MSRIKRTDPETRRPEFIETPAGLRDIDRPEAKFEVIYRVDDEEPRRFSTFVYRDLAHECAKNLRRAGFPATVKRL